MAQFGYSLAVLHSQKSPVFNAAQLQWKPASNAFARWVAAAPPRPVDTLKGALTNHSRTIVKTVLLLAAVLPQPFPGMVRASARTIRSIEGWNRV
jgi:hypothetical protein